MRSVPGDASSRRWWMLALLSAAELLGMSLWFAGTAVAPELATRWDLTPGEAAWLTTSVQLGFVAGTATSAILNLADVLPARALFSVSALLGAAATASLAGADTFGAAIALRFATGFALAGVYPPAMKMAATWFRERRGLAVGTVVGALTIGKAMPYLVHALPGAGARTVLMWTSVAAAAAAVVVAVAYREGPFPFAPRPFAWSLVATVVRERRWRLATGGYLGHMFELYSAWTWLPVFIAASIGASGDAASPNADTTARLLAFATLAVGGIGCVWGGLVADRIGRERLVTISMAASGACALTIGFAFGGSIWPLALLALAWGFFVIADSAQFSVLVTESVPAHAVGTALTLQTSLGFLLTTVTIQLIPPLVELIGWRWAFTILAAGPALGIAAIRRLAIVRR